MCYICCGLFPQFGCVLYLIFAIPSILALCFICCVLFPLFWPWAIFQIAVCYSLDFGCVLFLLCAIFVVCYSVPQFWLGPARGLGCALFLLYAIPFLLYAIPSILTVCCFCFMLCPQFWLCAIFAVFYSLNFGCGRYSLPVCYSPNLAVCYTICCVLFPQFRLFLLWAIPSILAVCDIRYTYIERPTYCTACLRWVSRVCLPGGVPTGRCFCASA